MKRLIALLVTLMLTASFGLAETTVLGCMPDGEYIHQYTAPNGQLLWFTALEQEPCIQMEDVNFDGHEDVVIFVVRGASNFYAEFFIYDSATDVYTLATHCDTDQGICNYQLYPELGIVESHTSNGKAGLLHVVKLYRWAGNNMKLIRSAVSDEWVEDIFEEDTYTRIIHGDTLHIRVWDHSVDGEDTIIHERRVTEDDMDHQAVYDEEMAALWQGLK